MKTKLRDSKLKEGLEDCTGGRVQAAHIFEKLTEDEILMRGAALCGARLSPRPLPPLEELRPNQI